MAGQTWVNLLNAGAPWQTTQGTQLATAVTAVISPRAAGPQDFILPGQPSGSQFYVGLHLRVRARGSAASGGTGSNLTVAHALGTSGAASGLATPLCTTAAIALGTTTLTSLTWRLEADIVCTAIGSSGNTLVSDGLMSISDTAVPALITTNTVTIPLPWLASAVSTYPSSPAAYAIGLNATLSAAFGNIQCNRFTVEQLN